MGEIIASGFVCLIGAGLLFAAFKDRYSSNDNHKILLLTGGIFVIIGIFGILNALGCGNGQIISLIMLWLIGGGMGFMMTYAAGFVIYTKIFCCKIKMQGTFEKTEAIITYKRGKRYVPCFSYSFQHKRYQAVSCFDSYLNKKRLEKRYIPGQEYPIFVSAKNPRDFVLKRRIWLHEWCMLYFGLVCDGVTVLVTCQQLAPFFAGV